LRKLALIGTAFGATLVALLSIWSSTAMAVDSITQISSFNDPRQEMATRPGTLWKATYGPYSIPAAGGGSPGSHFAFHNNLPVPPCVPNCRITDMVPDMVFADGSGNPTSNTANLDNRVYLHHYVFYQPGVADKTCPGGLPGSFGDRFFGSGNERTPLHLPTGYGYPLSSSTWGENVHLLNFTATTKSVYIQAIIRTEPNTQTQPAYPLWLDIDGCSSSGVPGDPVVGNSEYPIPVGISEQFQTWTSTVAGRIIGIAGHQHDTSYPSCVSSCPVSGGVEVSTERVGGPSSIYYGGPTSNPTPGDASTLCRSADLYNTVFGSPNVFAPYTSHMDTMSNCALYRDIPDDAQPGAVPAGGEYPALGLPLNVGDQLRIHGRYDSDYAVTDAMSIMNAWYTPRSESYAEAARVSLVPAYRQTISTTQCTARGGAASTHGAPLSLASCNPPAFVSGTIAHVGPKSDGYAEMVVLPGDLGTGGDEADVVFQAITTDIRSGSATGVDYDPSASDATLVVKWRISDNYNGGSLTDPATVQDYDFNVPVACAATADATIGSTCSVDSTADSIMPGVIKEGKAMNVQLFRLRLNDSGTNGTRGDADDRIFEQEGIYIR
jgi:hypothetical protein